MSSLNTATALSNPGTLPTGNGRCIAFHPSGRFVAVGWLSTTPFFAVYPVGPTAFGTKIADAGTLPTGSVTSVEWNRDGTRLFVTSITTPWIFQYSFDGSTLTYINSPATVRNDQTLQVKYHPTLNVLYSITHLNIDAPISWYTLTGDNFSDPPVDYAEFGDDQTAGVTFNCLWCDVTPDGKYLVVGNSAAYPNQTNVWLYVFPINANGSLGARLPFQSLALSQVNGLKVSRDGSLIAFFINSSPFVKVAPLVNGVVGSFFSNPGALPAGAGQNGDWTSDGAFLGVAHTTTPFATYYPMTSSAFGTKVTNPSTLPAGNGRALAFPPGTDTSGNFSPIVVNTTTPFVRGYVGTDAPFGSGSKTQGAATVGVYGTTLRQ